MGRRIPPTLVLLGAFAVAASGCISYVQERKSSNQPADGQMMATIAVVEVVGGGFLLGIPLADCDPSSTDCLPGANRDASVVTALLWGAAITVLLDLCIAGIMSAANWEPDHH